MLAVPASCCCLLVLNTNGSCCLVLFPSTDAGRPEVGLYCPWHSSALSGEVCCVGILLRKLCSPFLIWLRPIIPIDLTKRNCDKSCECAVLNWIWERSFISSSPPPQKKKEQKVHIFQQKTIIWYLIQILGCHATLCSVRILMVAVSLPQPRWFDVKCVQVSVHIWINQPAMVTSLHLL